jgi:hypothetical protein
MNDIGYIGVSVEKSALLQWRVGIISDTSQAVIEPWQA